MFLLLLIPCSLFASVTISSTTTKNSQQLCDSESTKIINTQGKTKRTNISVNVLLQRDGKGQLDRTCGKWRLLHIVYVDRSVVHTVKRRKSNWFGHILRTNCLLKHVIEGKIRGSIDVMVRRGRRRKQLLDDLNEKRVY
jgi:hypothetical protein